MDVNGCGLLHNDLRRGRRADSRYARHDARRDCSPTTAVTIATVVVTATLLIAPSPVIRPTVVANSKPSVSVLQRDQQGGQQRKAYQRKFFSRHHVSACSSLGRRCAKRLTFDLRRVLGNRRREGVCGHRHIGFPFRKLHREGRLPFALTVRHHHQARQFVGRANLDFPVDVLGDKRKVIGIRPIYF